MKNKEHRQIREYDIKLSEDQELLSGYLNQYRYSLARKKALERRKQDVIREFDMPISGVSIDGMPKGGGMGFGCAAISIRLDEIEQQIKEQSERAIKILTDIMSIVDYLPDSSLERSIIEEKYIDRIGWREVCRENNIGRSQAIRYWKKGLNDLLQFERVEKILKTYKAEKK